MVLGAGVRQQQVLYLAFLMPKTQYKNYLKQSCAHSICRHKHLNCPTAQLYVPGHFAQTQLNAPALFNIFPLVNIRRCVHTKNLCLLSSLFIYSHYFSGSAVFCDLTAQCYNK